MKSTLLFSLMILCFAQPALAQTFESDEQWQQQAANQMKMQNTGRVQQSAKKTAKKTTTRQNMRGLSARQNSFGASYGYRPQRSSIGSSYGYRPQRAQLMPAGQAEKMQQMRLKMQQKMQMMQMMSGQQPQSGANPLQGMMGGQQQGANPLQALMGGAAQQQPQQPGQPQLNRGELLKTLFGGGGASE